MNRILGIVGIATILAVTFIFNSSANADWYANNNDWGALIGDGGFSSFSTWKQNNKHLRSDWSGVYQNNGGYVVMYPSAVEGWNFGEKPSNSFWSSLNSGFAGCWFKPDIWNGWNGNDIWNTSLDIWVHTSKNNKTPSDEVMFWSKWKGISPLGSFTKNVNGMSLYNGWNGWNVRTLREWGKTGVMDVKELCLDGGTNNSRHISAIHAGAEVGKGTAKLKVSSFDVWHD